MKMKRIVLAICILYGCNNAPMSKNTTDSKELIFQSKVIATLGNISFRGLHVINHNVIWASGTGGTVVNSMDGGRSWNVLKVQSAESLDFRDIQVLTDSNILVMSAGFPCKIFKSMDAGLHWKEVYDNPDSSAFLDGMSFSDEMNGMAFGDPMNGKMLVLTTNNGGENWIEVNPDAIPEKLEEEAGFAASGSSIQLFNSGKAIIGMGGIKSRVFITDNNGKTWKVIETPMMHGSSSRGIYAMAFKNENEGLAVGGAWNEDSIFNSAIYTADGGNSWNVAEGQENYRSGVAYAGKETYVSVGSNGIDVGTHNGMVWANVDTNNMNAVQFDTTRGVGFAVGRKGNIMRIELK